MKFLMPKKQQWKRWSAPSKLTYVGTLLGIFSLLFSVFVFVREPSDERIISSQVELYKKQEIDFQSYEVTIRNILTTKQSAISFVSEKYGKKFDFLFNPTHIENLSQRNLRELQNLVISTGFLETDEPEMLLLLDELYSESDELVAFLKDHDGGDDEKQRELVKAMIVSLKLPPEQSGLYLKSLETLDKEGLNNLYKNLSSFVEGVSQNETIETSWKVLEQKILIHKLDSDDMKLEYILEKYGHPNNRKTFGLRPEQKLLVKYFSLEKRLIEQLDGYDFEACDRARDSEITSFCSLIDEKDIDDVSKSLNLRLNSLTCFDQKFPAPRTYSHDGCVLSIVSGDTSCSELYQTEMSSYAIELVEESESTTLEDKEMWKDFISSTGDNERDLTASQLSKLIQMLAIEKSKLYGLERAHTYHINKIDAACAVERNAYESLDGEVERLKNTDEKRAVIGATFKSAKELEIISLLEGFPAQNSGLKIGDVVEAIDGITINDLGDLSSYINTRASHVPILFSVNRNSEIIEFSITPTTMRRP